MSKRKQKLEVEAGKFLKQYARKRSAGSNPNDRQYDRKIEKKIKQLDPSDFDELMNGPSDHDKTEQGA